MRKEVLTLEYKEVFDKVAVRIVHQDEEVLKRGEFEDNSIKVFSISSPDFGGDKLFIRGDYAKLDNDVFVVSKEEAETIKEQVKAINHKYGKYNWRAEEGGFYYSMGLSPFGNFAVVIHKEQHSEFDDNFYKCGNYFKTRDQIEIAIKRMKDALKQYQDELGE